MIKIAVEHAGDVLICIRKVPGHNGDGIATRMVVVVRDTDRGSPIQIVARFKSEYLRAGLTPDEWRQLSRKIARAMKEPK